MKERWASGSKRFKTGTFVLYDGFYTDGWGGELLLYQGDRFPRHPEIGSTTWTYASRLTRADSRSSRDCMAIGR